MPDGLSRFKRAQTDPSAGFDAALSELRAGRKRGHWIWYVFPQLSGLGSSPMAVEYGLRGVEEAVAYLRDRVLRERLCAVTAAVASALRRQPAPRLDQVMGSRIDAQKVVSSVTLFGEVARHLHEEESSVECAALSADAATVLHVAGSQGYPPCAFTQRALRRLTV
jgi:uncharacterized protein (DUF1810 family)